jgi:hypothetical protein
LFKECISKPFPNLRDKIRSFDEWVIVKIIFNDKA